MMISYTEKMTAEEYNELRGSVDWKPLTPGDKIMFILGAAKGKEAFYEKFGFKVRPNEFSGSGMSMWRVKD